MQPNTITLVVDPLNNGTTENQVFSRFEELVNRTTYHGPAHTLSATETLQLYRTLPTRSGAFLGSLKTSAKVTKTISVNNADGDTVPMPLIIEVNASVPVGATAAQVKLARQRLIALLDDDSIAGPLTELGSI